MKTFKKTALRGGILLMATALLYVPVQSQQVQGTDYRIGPQDQLEVTVTDVPELIKRLVRVSEDGKISLPYLGEVEVDGLTSTEVERKLARLFVEKNFLQNPQVAVYIQEFASKIVTVIGAVTNPKSYPLLGRLRLLNIISTAGGLTTEAGDEIIIIRELLNGESNSIRIPITALFEGDISFNIPIEPNDIISVPIDRLVAIYVMGQVNKPGALSVKKSRLPTLLQAIAMAGGFTERAKKNNVIIKWTDAQGKQHQNSVNVKNIMNGRVKDVQLKENDIVVVKESIF
ncbi:MAG: polysaccharide export protein [Candidatus Aminicenantes bacterium]|nr:polysaccharide export protein [Candidatus Aminicenantes bacterium]